MLLSLELDSLSNKNMQHNQEEYNKKKSKVKKENVIFFRTHYK
jgi:hypothetical protein